MAEFLMPSLGSDMEDATLIEWEKQPGDAVARGDIIAVVETQKGAIEIEAYDDGILESLLVDIGKTVPVGTPLAMIRDINEASSTGVSDTNTAAPPPAAVATPPQPEPAPDPAPAVKEVVADTVADTSSASRVRISPAAKSRASENNIDLSSVKPTGPWQSIVLADIDEQSGSVSTETNKTDKTTKDDAPPVTLPVIDTDNVEVVELSGMRDAIAASMSRAKREIPHYYLRSSIDLTTARQWISNTNDTRPPEKRVLMGALLLKAVATACLKYPEFNGHFIDGKFLQSKTVHTGMAVNLRSGGLVAPAIHNAQTLSVDKLMTALRDVVGRTRAGRFRSTELTDATITVSSLGDRGVDALYAVIYPPQVAIIGFGTPADRPAVLNGEIVIQHQIIATLAADHRVSDGHRGSRFLETIGKLLQTPETL